MQITKNFFSKTVLSIALVSISNLTFADNSTSQQESNITNGGDNIILTASKRSAPSNDDHLKEHGGQIYQLTRLENAWLVDEDGKGNLGTRFDTLIGTDENRLFIEVNSEKPESSDINYDISALYSRNVAPFWDVQAGVRYSEDKNNRNSNRIDGVIGLLGLAPYFFETQAYLYGGENNFWGASFELERDLLLTQKLITQPYIEADVVFSDDSNYAAKSGLSELKTGIQTRYEITKRFKPFIDIAYQYEKGQQDTFMQEATNSEKGWKYGAGIELVF
ncbi:copper resistance protein B [Acinetobacter johnsonii]|uniref:copper resistance protein B n=1 Tax=Acinetobacter johnsonii TaxID=40214 RepID=UPI0024480D3D|nr:copper resistance protein B [Acinetobacter johnsonii]MDH1489240.1 copper resistance protein B [Acinetobacter johnsonii]MDH1615172.1 copper resistance protein B [Acinetobacter johnsonii]